jgi:hypothetical protein
LYNLLEIPNYLSAEECDDIIRLAKEQGLETSTTMDEDVFEDVAILQEDQADILKYYDYNKDGFLDIDEVPYYHQLSQIIHYTLPFS